MKKRSWYLRCAVMILFPLLAGVPVFLQLYRLFSPERPWLFLTLYIFVLFLIMGCFGRIRGSAPYGLKCLGAYGMGLYICLSLAAALTVFLPIPPWLMLFCGGILALCGFLHTRKIAVKTYAVPLLKRPFRLVLISDVHLGAVGSEERLPRLIECINGVKPDLVCIAGDLIDNSFPAVRNAERAANLLKKIECRHGVFACLGNHDAGKSAGDMLRFMENAGIRVLPEAYVTVGEVQLLGRVDGRPHGDYVNSVRGDTAALLAANPRPELPLIVIDHNPAVISQYDERASLILCGHTHNGQIFPGNLVVKAINTCGYGYYRRDEKSPHVVVSSGAGAWGPPLRLGTDCEIAVIELGK